MQELSNDTVSKHLDNLRNVSHWRMLCILSNGASYAWLMNRSPFFLPQVFYVAQF